MDVGGVYGCSTSEARFFEGRVATDPVVMPGLSGGQD